MSLSLALSLLRMGVAVLFMLHAIVRVLTPGSLAQFGRAMTHLGIPQGEAVVWALTGFEIGAGLLMIVGIRTRLMAGGYAVILLTGIVLIHRKLGWFVGEHGTGGSEYSVALLLALLVIAAADATDGVRVPMPPALPRDTSDRW
ncbi:MAG: DoxX family protein [Aquincola sp.]|nr:DoxX family protein [Aquincola sp.]